MSYSNTSEGMFLGGCSRFTQSCIQAGSAGKTGEDKTVFPEYVITSNVNLLCGGMNPRIINIYNITCDPLTQECVETIVVTIYF